MYEETFRGTRSVILAIAKGIIQDSSIGSCMRRVAAVLSSTAWLDGTMRADIRAQAEALARPALLLDKEDVPYYLSSKLEDVMKAWNRAYKRRWVRTKGPAVLTRMKIQRARKDPVVFYLVSSHQKPQPAHEPLQGKILVDYFWKSALSDDPRVPVLSRIVKSRKIRTVQWAMGAPHYLLTRVNCKHFLIPIHTNDIISMNTTDIKNKYQPKRTGVKRPISDMKRRAEYNALRATVFEDAKKLV